MTPDDKNAQPSPGARRAGTRIVATIGPVSAKADTIAAIIKAGMDVARINLSHGDRSLHDKIVRHVRKEATNQSAPVAIMGDLCGPKIRVIDLDEPITVSEGDPIDIVRDKVDAAPDAVATTHPGVVDEVHAGHRVLIDDGTILLRVQDRLANRLHCKCEIGGTIKSRKGVNLPDSDLNVPALTDKDLDDLAWVIRSKLDFVALSFVRKAADVRLLRDRLEAIGRAIPIVSKIETPQALRDIDAIIEESDAVLIARGDLGVEVDVERVPLIQKDVAERCRQAGKPVIVATQMLQSMVSAAVPTRAEVSDVANAIMDGADAVMLSAETAVGDHPLRSVETMRRIAVQSDSYHHQHMRWMHSDIGRKGVTQSVASGIHNLAAEVDAQAVVIWTQRGRLAALLAKYRLDTPVVALTPTEEVVRQMSLCYGITASQARTPEDLSKRVKQADRILRQHNWAQPGDLVVIGFGARTLQAGATGAICVHVVNENE